MTANKQTDK